MMELHAHVDYSHSIPSSVLLGYYFAFVLPIIEHCSPVWGSAAECHLQLLEGQVYSVARLCPDQFRVIDVAWLGLVCCTRLIRTRITRTRITVCSASFHLLLQEFDITQAAATAHPLEFEVSSVERPNLLGFPAGSGSNVE